MNDIETVKRLRAQRREAEAESLCDAILKNDPDDFEALKQRAHIRRFQKNFDGALADINRMVDMLPTHVGYRFERGKWRLCSGDHHGAYQDFSRCIELESASEWKPFTEGCYFIRAFVLVRLDRPDEAQRDLGNVSIDYTFWISGELVTWDDVRRLIETSKNRS